MTKLSIIVDALDTVAPLGDAEEWDNVGLLVGDPSSHVSRALFAIDMTPAVLAEAGRRNCQLVVAYHPPIFKGERQVLAGSIPFDAVRAGIAIYSPHTALDVAAGGTNDVLADAVEMTDRAALKPARRAESAARGLGLGRTGRVAPVGRSALIERIKRALGLSHVLVAGPRDGQVTRVAVCAGSAGDLLFTAARAGVDLYLTGEVRHHDALAAAKLGMTVVCALHSNSERVALPSYLARVTAAVPGLGGIVSEADADPFTIA